MGKKGDFEGEYDFFDNDDSEEDKDDDEIEDEDEEYDKFEKEIRDREGDEEDLTEKDIDNESEDEDIQKNKEKREFLSKRQHELSDTIAGFIANGGYKQTYPNIHFSDIIDGDYITFLFEEENQFEILTEDELELWNKGKLNLNKQNEEVLRKWYPSGTYAVFKKLTHLNKRYAIEENETKWKNLEDLIELNEDNFIKAKKIELATAYNESGKRLNDLYMAIYGRTDERHFRMGCFRISVPVMFYEDKMKKSSYRDSTSFFEDFKKTYEFIFSLRGNLVIGALTDKCYESIGSTAYGEGTLKCRNSEFEIRSTIIREEWFERRACYSLVKNINLHNEEFMYWLNKYYPKINVAETDEGNVFFEQGKEINGEYCSEEKDNSLIIKGSIEKQEKIINGLLKYITK